MYLYTRSHLSDVSMSADQKSIDVVVCEHYSLPWLAAMRKEGFTSSDADTGYAVSSGTPACVPAKRISKAVFNPIGIELGC